MDLNPNAFTHKARFAVFEGATQLCNRFPTTPLSRRGAALHFDRGSGTVAAGLGNRPQGSGRLRRPFAARRARGGSVIEAVLIVFIFALGACVGSFLNVVIYRMPREESIVFPPSHCPKCGRGIKWHDNIPILSWLALGGRCRFCKVKISPQYILVEAATGAMLVGLYLWYFVLEARRHGLGPGSLVGGAELEFIHAWPMFLAQAALLCGLLACAAVDMEHFIVPLPVMWTVAILGAAAAAFRPHPFGPTATAGQAAVALAAGVGLVISLLAMAKGYLTPSFIDAPEAPEPSPDVKPKAQPVKGRGKGQGKGKGKKAPGRAGKRGSVGVTAADGVRPRVEVLREVLFLLPALVLAVGAGVLLREVPAAGRWWNGWFDPAAHPTLAPRLAGVGGALFGFLIGGAWVWGVRILATLGFGKEAMGMGDVHILAGVGAVTGWVVPSLAFFVAPLCGLPVVLYVFLDRRQRELPFGPWLAVGTALVMLFYDGIVEYIGPGISVMVG